MYELITLYPSISCSDVFVIDISLHGNAKGSLSLPSWV